MGYNPLCYNPPLVCDKPDTFKKDEMAYTFDIHTNKSMVKYSCYALVDWF